MQRIRHTLRGAMLYLLMVLFATGAPLSTLVNADDSTQSQTSTQNDPSPSPSTSPDPSPSPSPAATKGGSTDSNASINADSATTNPDPSPATVTDNNNAAATNNVNNGVNLTNNLDSNATTGDTKVNKNTTAGDAQSGDANAGSTIVNSVHSSVGSGNTSGIANFTINLNGDITGDITIGPTIANATVDKNTNISSNTNINNNDTLTNNQTLSATSGNADVSQNTTAGSAKSGNANSVADVLNLINTIIAANKSFIGTINIYGNLDGDILVSPEFLPQLLGSNAPVYGNFSMPLSTNINDNQSIVNNVNLKATSGQATVSGNTTAGTAQTGNAQTNLTILNLTGHQVVASQSLLVFVNVLGKWVGMIVDAPGATSAALGNGVISDNTTLSSNNNLNNNAKIVNNIDLSATSGDANVSDNTTAGDAVSGNATASANIANISTSTFNLSDWFGVLFINVFGTWVGSFGVDTAAGNIIPLSGDALPNGAPLAAGASGLRFGFNPIYHSGTPFSSIGGGGTAGSGGGPMTPISAHAPLNQAEGQTQPLAKLVTSPFEDTFSVIMIIAGFGTAAGAGALWLLSRRSSLPPTPPKQGEGQLVDVIKSQL
ncbi:MAG TPA: hypothetical protein VMT96_00820 [Candidatus Bathyarchaeia archaeon]|nr:hypothetical protein [Candidatus Bathyarchaeia archaeon]